MRCRERRRWGAKRQAAACAAEDVNEILILPRAGGSLASAPSYPAIFRRLVRVSLKLSSVGLYHPRFVTLAR